MRREKGFDTIELLIFIAILGILAAVVIPNVVGLLGKEEKEKQEATATPTIAATPTSTPKGEWQNCYCYETEEVTGVLSATERGYDYTKLHIGNTTLRVYDEFWGAGSYSWQGQPKNLKLEIGKNYYIKTMTKYSTSCQNFESGNKCGSWKSAWNTEILEIRIIESE